MLVVPLERANLKLLNAISSKPVLIITEKLLELCFFGGGGQDFEICK